MAQKPRRLVSLLEFTGESLLEFIGEKPRVRVRFPRQS